MDSIALFLTYLHSFTHLPLYYYRDDRLSFCVPAGAIDYAPPEKYLNAFRTFGYIVAYLTTDFGGLYGYVRWKAENAFCILGPVTAVSYDNATLFAMRREFNIEETISQSFHDFLKGIPCRNITDFTSELVFLNYSINREDDIPHDLNYKVSELDAEMVGKRFVDQQIVDKEASWENNSLDVETPLLRYVENGDMEGLQAYLQLPVMINSGVIGNSSLRNEKNIFIVSATLYCRAAIQGGLPSELAFHLSDSYIQQMEILTNIEAVRALSGQILFDYTKRVADNKSSSHGDPVLQKAIRYVHHHTNAHITVADVAEYVGFSRGYLSTLFKEQLGFELSAFIRRCKLEESRELLRYSDKSIAEISSYLCFSSQSHFQNCFKKQYNITPQQYRRGAES